MSDFEELAKMLTQSGASEPFVVRAATLWDTPTVSGVIHDVKIELTVGASGMKSRNWSLSYRLSGKGGSREYRAPGDMHSRCVFEIHRHMINSLRNYRRGESDTPILPSPVDLSERIPCKNVDCMMMLRTTTMDCPECGVSQGTA